MKYKWNLFDFYKVSRVLIIFEWIIVVKSAKIGRHERFSRKSPSTLERPIIVWPQVQVLS